MPTPARASPDANAAAASRWAGGPDCEPVKTATRTRGSAAVDAVDRLGDADRLVAALALDGHREHVLQAAGDLGDLGERGAGPHLRPDRHRGGEADLVEAVVHAH